MTSNWVLELASYFFFFLFSMEFSKLLTMEDFFVVLTTINGVDYVLRIKMSTKGKFHVFILGDFFVTFYLSSVFT